jgi:hypothetical protein
MTGILTFHRGPNYGGFLQAWHLREAIRSLGHQATIINYQSQAQHEAERIRWPSLTPGGLKGFVFHAFKSRPFPRAVRELSDSSFTTDAGQVDWQEFSSVVVGSDIVWNFSSPVFGSDPVFYGMHPAQRNARFVAYAPSCGEANLNGPLPDHVTAGLPRFDSIQVRDEATAGLVERVIGIRPPLVVDPTWLQDDPEIPYKKRPHKPYALVYGPGANQGKRPDVLGTWCRKRGLDLVACAVPCRAASHRILSIGPFEWIDLFRHAECVVTSTFHGLLYAIKYNKPVVFMVRGPSRSKSAIAIERCNLQDRVVEEGEPFTEELLAHALDSANGTMLPEEWIRESREALEMSLVARSGSDRT